MSALRPADYEIFARFSVPAELVDSAGIERVSDAEAREYGITGIGDMSGLVFPYFLPGSNGHRATCRIRRDHPEMEDGKSKDKYKSPFGDVRHLYFPPNATELLRDAAAELLFVEAEKSSLALTAWAGRTGRKMLAIATGGCWGWRGRIGKTVDPSGARVDETGPLPDLACAGNRKVTILFDANSATNPKVDAARFAFAAALRKLKAAAIAIPNLPTRGNRNVNGPDDFLREFGDQAMADILNGAVAEEGVGITMLDKTQLKDMHWLWPNRIPAGYLSVFSGNPDAGKTTIALDLVARYTTGREWPDKQPNTIDPGYALLMIAEDGAEDVIKPRLVAAGADCTRIGIMVAKVPAGDKKERYFTLDQDLERLEQRIKQPPYFSLVVADPLSSYLGKADMNKEQDVRRVLGPIKEMCERTSVTFLALGHFNKRSDVSALGAVSGAVANTGLPRAVFLCMKDPRGEKGDMLMLLGKGNLTRRRTGLRYRFREEKVICDNGLPNFVPVIDWRGEENEDADDVQETARNPEQKASLRAEHFLRDFLKDDEKPSAEILAAAAKVGIKRRTLFTAKKDLDIRAVRKQGSWWWQPLESTV
jgi:putative DNA primase/helicase